MRDPLYPPCTRVLREKRGEREGEGGVVGEGGMVSVNGDTYVIWFTSLLQHSPVNVRERYGLLEGVLMRRRW